VGSARNDPDCEHHAAFQEVAFGHEGGQDAPCGFVLLLPCRRPWCMVDTRVGIGKRAVASLFSTCRAVPVSYATRLYFAVAHTTYARTELGALKRSVASNAVVSNELLAASLTQWRPVEEMLRRGLLFEKMKQQNRQMFYQARPLRAQLEPNRASLCLPSCTSCSRLHRTSPVRRARCFAQCGFRSGLVNAS
jgi:hypothetical protein